MKPKRRPIVPLLSPAFLLAMLAVAALDRIPLALAGLYVVLSVVLFAAYGLDKAAARRGGWRASEASLHLMALAGGWPGALVAQHVFRHKTIKQPFQRIFWSTVFINCTALVALVSLVGERAGLG